MFTPKPNTGTLFSNDRKEPGSRQPDMKGNVFLDPALLMELMNGAPEGELIKMDISGWENDSGRIGLSFAKPYVKPAPAPAPQPDPDEEVPF